MINKRSKTEIIFSLNNIESLKIENSYVVENTYLYESIVQNTNIKNIVVDNDETNTYGNFVKESKLQKKIYLKFINILSKRLNLIHKRSFNDNFWEKIIGLEVLMHIHHCRNIYRRYEKIWKNQYNVGVVKSENFYIPKNNSDYRNFSQHNELGYEQLLSILIQRKYKNYYFKNSANDDSIEKKSLNFKKKIFNFFNKLTSKKNKIILISIRRILSLFFKIFIKPKVLLVQTIFSNKNYIKLMLFSFGKIQTLNNIKLNHLSNEIVNIDINKRKIISNLANVNDEFEIFFFETLFYFTPISWIEDYENNVKNIEEIIKKYSCLKFIISESASEEARLFSAVANDKNIKTLYNEHNFMQHFILGNIIWMHLRNYNKFLSLGWKDNDKVIPVGSLYEWTGKIKKTKNDLLFISSVASSKSPLYSSAYGEQGYTNAISYFEMNNTLFKNLDIKTINRIYFRGHPHVKDVKYKDYVIDDYFYLKDYMSQFKKIDYNANTSAVDLILKSKLVIINYLSTPWLQSLIANVPTIILVNKKTYFFDAKYQNIFNDLEKNNIIFFCPILAAKFINKINDDPFKWWKIKQVQEARKNFLNSNFMINERLSNYLLDLSKNTNNPNFS